MGTGSDAPDEHEPGLRERKKQRTRETIVRAALELFAQQGFQGTTIRDIAEAADVSPRTVSAYFPVKEQLVFHDHEDLFGELKARLDDRLEGETAIDALRAWIIDVLGTRHGLNLEHMRCRRTLVESDPGLRTYERGLQERFEQLIAQAVAVDLGVPGDDLIPHMVAAATMAALDALGREIKQADEPRADLVPQMLALVDQAMTFIGGGVHSLAQQPQLPGVTTETTAAR